MFDAIRRCSKVLRGLFGQGGTSGSTLLWAVFGLVVLGSVAAGVSRMND